MPEIASETLNSIKETSTRRVSYQGTIVDMAPVANLSRVYDKSNWEVDTLHIALLAAVLGNAAGRESVDGDRTNAITAVLGRKYNNARTTIPFPMDFVRQNEAKIMEIYDRIVRNTVGACLELQSELTGPQLEAGKRLSIISEAIRIAKKELSNSGSAVDQAMLLAAIEDVKGEAPAKLFLEYGLTVSGRTSKAKEERELGIWKKKQIESADNQKATRYVAFANAAGLKRVPIYTASMRDKAENLVLDFASLAMKVIQPISIVAYNPDLALKALASISTEMKQYKETQVTADRYSENERAEVSRLASAILKKVRAI